MQETTLFDTHAAVKRLTEAGMPVSQAEAVVASQAEVMLHSLANKQDIESFRSETTENFASTHKSVDALRAEVADCHRNIALTRKDVENLRSETRKDIATIHKDIEALRAELKTDIEALRADTKKDISIIQKDDCGRPRGSQTRCHFDPKRYRNPSCRTEPRSGRWAASPEPLYADRADGLGPADYRFY